MKIEIKEKYKVVTPGVESDYLTDGETISQLVFMPLDADVTAWREITAEEADELKAQQESEVENGNG